MRGSEGGIPYNTPKRKLTVHARKEGSFSAPACGTTASHYQTHHDPSKVTCWQCIRDLKDAGVLDGLGKVAS